MFLPKLGTNSAHYVFTESVNQSSFQNQNKSPLDNVVQEDDAAEKGETDSFCKENILSDDEEKEQETPNKENLFRQGSFGDLYGDINRKVTDGTDKDKVLRITHSVTIDDFGKSAPKIIFQQSHESVAGETVSSMIAVSTAKVKCMSSNMRLEINEVVQSEDSDFKTTLILQSGNGKGTEACFQSQKDKTPHKESSADSYTWNQSANSYKQNARHCKNVSYKVSIAELRKDDKDTCSNSSSLSSQEQMDCCKSCCRDNFCRHNDTDFTLVDGSSTCSSPFGFWLPQRQLSLPDSLSNETLWDIPPPIEFADKETDTLQNLMQNVESCQINDDVFKDERHSPYGSEAAVCTSWSKTSKCQPLLDEGKGTCEPVCCNQLYDLDTQEHLYPRSSTPVNRSSFTKKFIQNHEGKMRMRNNSIAILETKTQANGYIEMPTKRRRTFPGVVYLSGPGSESIPSCRESFSSGTLSSFFMQSLPSQAERAARFFLEDERLGISEKESRKSSSSSSYRPSSSSIYGPDNIKAYSTTKNPFYPTRSAETPEEVFLKNEQDLGELGEDGEMIRKSRADRESISAGPLELSEVTESGFDEEMLELDEFSSVALAEDINQKDPLIQVTPPSPCNSDEHISDGGPSKTKVQIHEDKEVAAGQKKRRCSVMTISVGEHEQRYLQNNTMPTSEDISHSEQSTSATETFSKVFDPPTEQLDVQNQDMEESHQASQPSISSCSLSENPEASDSSTKGATNDQEESQAEVVCCRTNKQMDKFSTGVRRTSRSYPSDFAERQAALKCRLFQSFYSKTLKTYLQWIFQILFLCILSFTASLEVKEHLKPPGDCAYKDSEETSDHWAKKRKLFKESKQWSSTERNSMTSIITEESGDHLILKCKKSVGDCSSILEIRFIKRSN